MYYAHNVTCNFIKQHIILYHLKPRFTSQGVKQGRSNVSAKVFYGI